VTLFPFGPVVVPACVQAAFAHDVFAFRVVTPPRGPVVDPVWVTPAARTEPVPSAVAAIIANAYFIMSVSSSVRRCTIASVCGDDRIARGKNPENVLSEISPDSGRRSSCERRDATMTNR
jgi:hypothetical protein